jgi:hypothetical protein
MKHRFILIFALFFISTFPAISQISVGINGGPNVNFASVKVTGRDNLKKSIFTVDSISERTLADLQKFLCRRSSISSPGSHLSGGVRVATKNG